MFYKNISILFLIFVTSCGLKQPEDSTEQNLIGSVYVTSNIDSARIFVNSSFTNKVTPDTIKNLPIGSAIVRVFKDGYIINPDSIMVNININSLAFAEFSLEYITNQGKVFINSTPSGAEIVIDNSPSGKYTPDTVIVAAGSHHFELYKNGFDSLEIGTIEVITNTLTLYDETLVVEKQVLIESFANSSCLPCTTTNALLENFIATHNSNKYTLIEYFTNWPNFLDPMYQHNPDGNSERFTYYNVRAVPSMFIAGNTVNPTDYNAITSAYNNELANATQDISLSLTKQISDSIKVKAELTKFSPLPPADWRLLIAVIEKEVVFSSPPGSNGLTKFSHVFRKFLTPDVGEVLIFNGGNFTKTYSGSISPEWDLNEIQVIGFIQNRDAKTVIKSSHL